MFMNIRLGSADVHELPPDVHELPRTTLAPAVAIFPLLEFTKLNNNGCSRKTVTDVHENKVFSDVLR